MAPLTARSILLISLSALALMGTGCGSPDAEFDKFVEDFRSKYAQVVTEGDELVSVSGEVEVYNGIHGRLKYTVKRTDDGTTVDVVMHVDYQFKDGRWKLIRSFPIHEGDLREVHRERSKAEGVSGLLIEVSKY